jgi:hypothetical protein
MKTKFIFLAILMNLGTVNAQNESLPSIAVANPNVNAVGIKQETAAKMMRLELIKINKHKVYDEFDMADVLKAKEEFRTLCYGQNCLAKLGTELKVDYIMCGSIDGLGNKIALTIKIVDVKSQTIYKSNVKEFYNQELEIQRMIEIVIKEMLLVPVDKVLLDRLAFKNELITSNNVGKVNNSGPRIGAAFLTGSVNEFAMRSTDQGGLGILPIVSMIGYQIEGQYVGTENFSALVEGIVNVSGLEQGQFIPSLTIMNGFRFGKSGWEFAFGPGFSVKSTSSGFFDTENLFGTDNQYFSENDWQDYAYENFRDDPQYNTNDYFIMPEATEFNSDYKNETILDKRGAKSINTTFVFAAGRTFRAGSLNIPVNIFYSSQKGGGYAGINVGFNVLKSKKPMNSKSYRN